MAWEDEMAKETATSALPFDRSSDGCLIPKMQKPCCDAAAAVCAAQAMSELHAGAVAFSREIDLQAGTATDVCILGIVGQVPSVNFLGRSETTSAFHDAR